MCKCVRDADRLDSLKPHYTVNDVSTDIEIKKGTVNLSCTRFKTRIRQSSSQVRSTLHTHIRSTFDRRLWFGLTVYILYDYSTFGSRPTKAKLRGT